MRFSLILAICFFFTILPFSLFSEGTKQILLSDAGHGKIQINPGFNNFGWYASTGTSATAEFRLHIHVANVGETIHYGFGDPLNNNDQVVNDVQYRIKDPSGNIVVGPTSIPLSGVGHISTFAQAVAGPNGIVGMAGYPQLSYTATTTGDYFIEFNFPTGFGGHDRTKFRYFDITVGSLSNQAVDGRVWSKAWQMTADNQAPPTGEYTFWGKLFVYSDDGIVTSINFNGMEPFVFAVSCNPWGCYNTGNFNNDRRSVTGNHTLTQYKIFLNNPDINVYPTGILGSVVPPILVTPDCPTGTATITVEVTKAGNVDILLDIDPTPGVQARDVQLSSAVAVGPNNILWNGLDGLGQPVPHGQTFNVTVTYINGLTNLPIYDVEQNPSGFIIELTRPTGPVPPVFWNDILVGGTQNFTGCLSALPSTGCHTFSGNNNTMNTWWYAVTSTSAPVVFTEQRVPDPPPPINGPSSLCPGSNGQIYWILKEPNSSGYNWGYSGTGATITTISVDFSNSATSGNITVSGVNLQCGAGIAQTKAVTILPSPVVSLSPFTQVCINTPPFTLSGGSPAGGTYWLSGFPATTFDPATQGIGSHNVTYVYTDPGTGCTASSVQPVVVNSNPVVSQSAVPGACIDAAPFTLTGGNPAGGTYAGNGVTGGVTFTPSSAGVGGHTVWYRYITPVGCTDSASTVVTVWPLPSVTFTPPAPVCINATPVALSGGTPAGGLYSGPGIAGGLFDPAVAGIGTHTLTYTYTDINGCTNANTASITVNPLPGAATVPSGPAGVCPGAAGVGYSSPAITDAGSYQWNLTPGSAGTITGTSNNATVNWSASYTGLAQITVTGVNPCGTGTTSPPLQVTIYDRPPVTFVRCTDTVTTTQAKPIVLKGGTPLGGTYSGSGVNSATGTFNPAASGVGNIQITYTYINSNGCNAAAVRTISVRAPAAFTCGGQLRDIRDNQNYPTVLLGTQCWMARNLNYGSVATSALAQRDNCVVEKYCYDDLTTNCGVGGGLYQWDEIMLYAATSGAQGICPAGWHIPTDAEWTTLYSNYINNGFAASPLKSTGYSGFAALVTGVGLLNSTMRFNNFASLFWSSDSHGTAKAWAHGMNTPDPSVSHYPSFRSNAFSVRCLKD